MFGLFDGKLFYGTDPALSGFNPNCDWFAEAKYGAFVHYLAYRVNDPERPHSFGKHTDWDTCVNEFDTEKFAEDMAAAGVGYVIFTLQQCDGYICIPSATYDELLGTKPGERCATRDLVSDLADSLDKRGIPLMLYFTADGMWREPDKMTKLCEAEYPTNPAEFKAHHWTAQFKRKWFSIAREWSLRYGKRIKGWWIDGADATKGFSDAELMVYRENLKVGNPDAIVTFNPGDENLEPWRYSIADDYTAGESGGFDDYPEGRWWEGAQWHLISYTHRLLPKCAEEGTDAGEVLAEYVGKVAEKQGVVSIDLSVYRDGSVFPEELAVIKKVKEAVRG